MKKKSRHTDNPALRNFNWGDEMKKELTTVIMVMVDGKVKPLEDLTDEEHSRMLAAMAHRLTESMSDYYAQHPDEVKELAKIWRNEKRRQSTAKENNNG